MDKKDKKRLFSFGKEYLLKRPNISNGDINYYLDLWKIRKPKSINDICYNMISHSSNRQGMPNAIGDIKKLSKILCEYYPIQIKVKYVNWEQLFKTIKENRNYTPPGRMVIDNSHSFWVIFCKSIISIANYLSRFSSYNEYILYVDTFISDNPDIRLAFPLILKEEIFGYGFALACDFTKEYISPEFIKPDTHIRDIFTGVGLCNEDDNDYNIFRKVIKYCQDINEVPYAVDKLFWLIGSGKLHETSEKQEIRFKSSKSEFIKEFKKT